MQIGDYIRFSAPSLFHDGGKSYHTGVIARLPRESPTGRRDRFYVVISGGKALHVPPGFIEGPAPGIPPVVDIPAALAKREEFRFRRRPVPG
jgi:hypothetical protein